MMKILYFDCFSGISGDMTLGALLDITRDIPVFNAELDKIGLKGEWEFLAQHRQKFGITGTDADVLISHHHDEDHHHAHRGFTEIKTLIEGSGLKQNVKDLSIRIFHNLAQAEAQVHGVPVEEVHFHEVGAVDAVIDIVGSAILIDQIAPDAIFCSPVNTGSGRVMSAHGMLPVPAPATANLLKGLETYSDGTNGELATPTGAAILKTVCSGCVPLPLMRVAEIGYGFGKKDFGKINAVRVLLGEPANEAEKILALEANIDDMTGEALGAALQMILDEGALDAYFLPVYMKKQRPAVVFCVVCRLEDRNKFEKLILKHTSTLGVRSIEYSRAKLSRSEEMVITALGTVRVKTAKGFGIIKQKAEYEDIVRIAKEHGLSFDEAALTVSRELTANKSESEGQKA
jgi:uncharacterized protein (TIGR00299 family) protein